MPAATGRRHHALTLALLALLAAEALLFFLGGHRGAHVARDLLVPGAGTIDEHPWLGLGFMLLAIAATVCWLRWGADWLFVAVVVGAALTTALTVSPDASAAGSHASPFAPAPAAHEFPLVILVAGALSWVRSVFVRVPVVRRLTARRRARRPLAGLDDLSAVPAADRARAIAIAALADGPSAQLAAQAADPALARRARRVGIVARARFGGDPFRRDHAHARAGRVLSGVASPDEVARFAADAARSPVGVVCSEPGWVRPLDAVLAALALQRAGQPAAGQAVRRLFAGPWALRGGHRPAWCWTPATLSAGRAEPWEHATATALAHHAGWLPAGDGSPAGDHHPGDRPPGGEGHPSTDAIDWSVLRRPALGAAARGTDHPHDERLVAAARLWLALLPADTDPEASRILARPTIRRDPVAVAIDRLAQRLS